MLDTLMWGFIFMVAAFIAGALVMKLTNKTAPKNTKGGYAGSGSSPDQEIDKLTK